MHLANCRSLASPTDSSDEALFKWRDAAGDFHEQTPKVGVRGIEVRESEEDLPDFFLFAANHVVGSNENAGRFSELRRAGRADSFIKLITKEYPWIKGLDIEVVAGSPVIYAKLGKHKASRPLAYVSAGISRTISIMLAIASRNHSVCLVDEIEDGVFHSHHEQIWRALLTLLRSNDGQMFATTHNNECIKALLKAAGDRVEDIALWRLERGRDDRPILYKFDGPTFSDAVEYGAEARG
jgi:hypothetical protein